MSSRHGSTRTIIRDLPAGYWSWPLRLVRVEEEPPLIAVRPRVEWHLEVFHPDMLDNAAPWEWGVCARFATRKDAFAHLTLLVTGGREVPT